MDALIIAAGFGSRLRDLSDSKPMTPVAGVPLLELGVRQAKAAGAAKVVVATGHEAEMLEAALCGLTARCGIPIEAARVDDWSKPNGWSVITGAARIDGDYLLMMADHIFSDTILTGLAAQGGKDRGVTLAIDRNTDNPLVDPDDATWVETEEHGFIRAIGKSIPVYDAVDCGAFLATPELSLAIAAAIAAGKAGSLSDGMQALADAGRAATWDVGGAWWLDVDDPRAHALAEAQAPRELAAVYAAAMGI
ncbi:NTP transferase domain-containing protein [Novosphingobium sp.]|uniref:phosphocholine cytidylyltransferase family protein n=1 Tax=Novosphingobium sp. TaxID=1874826 RepID=UPI0025DD5F79|nr:NTP transferase domain-containing protein [Novosphingobium sp.]